MDVVGKNLEASKINWVMTSSEPMYIKMQFHSYAEIFYKFFSCLLGNSNDSCDFFCGKKSFIFALFNLRNYISFPHRLRHV